MVCRLLICCYFYSRRPLTEMPSKSHVFLFGKGYLARVRKCFRESKQAIGGESFHQQVHSWIVIRGMYLQDSMVYFSSLKLRFLVSPASGKKKPSGQLSSRKNLVFSKKIIFQNKSSFGEAPKSSNKKTVSVTSAAKEDRTLEFGLGCEILTFFLLLYPILYLRSALLTP